MPDEQSLLTCPSCGGLFDPSGKPYAGRPCTCGHFQINFPSSINPGARIKQLETELQQKSEELFNAENQWNDATIKLHEQIESLTKSNHAMRKLIENFYVFNGAAVFEQIAGATFEEYKRCIELERMKG